MLNKNSVSVVHKAAVPAAESPRETDFVRPSTDICETEDAYMITIDMPGVPKGALTVTMEQDSLVIKGIADLAHSRKANLLVSELQQHRYYRSFNLGEGIDRSSVDARYESGVLTLKLLKKEEIRPREIAIR